MLFTLLNPVLQVIMVQKRPFDDGEILEVSFKHPKHGGPYNELVPISDSVFPVDDRHTHMPKTSGGSLVDDPFKVHNQLCSVRLNICLLRSFKLVMN